MASVKVSAITTDGFNTLRYKAETTVDGERYEEEARTERMALLGLKWKLDMKSIAAEYPKTIEI